MDSPALVISPYQSLIGSLDEQNLEIHVFISFKPRYACLKITEKTASAHVNHKGSLLNALCPG